MSETHTRTRGEVTSRRRGRSRLVALSAGVALACAGLTGLAERPAAAASGTITGATLEWTVSDEANAASFNGQCNFMSAGKSDGSASTYTATDGNATVLKLNASDEYVPISSYASRCLDKTGAPVNFLSGAAARRLGQKVRFTGGTGTLDPATGAATIQWTGSFSINFYGTLVPFWMTDPKLVVDASGNGQITATMGGYASDMANPELRVPLPETPNVVIATLSGVDGDNTTGFTTTPVFSGVEYDVDPESGQPPQNRVNPGWGAWPESFVDFQMQTGLGSYWYSSGSSVDVRKPPFPLTVGYGTFTEPKTTTATPNANLNPAVSNTIAVTGSGFTGLAPSEQGIYTGLVNAADWQPGQVPDVADFIGATFTPKALIAGGAYSTSITVPANAVTDASATYGIATFCAHACSLTNRAFDSFTPVDFATPDPTRATVGTPYETVIAPFSGVAPYTWSVKSGVLAPGLSLNPSTGSISGTPTTEGKFTVVIEVADSKLPKPKKVTSPLTINVAPEDFRITTETLPGIDARVPYEHQIEADGGVGPYRYKVTGGTRPQGIRVTGTGLVKGKSKVHGIYEFTVTVTDKFKYAATKTYTVEVAEADVTVVVDQSSLPSAPAGQAYSQTLTASGGTIDQYTFQKVSGTLPPKVTLKGSTGLISGTPTKLGSYTFEVVAKDKHGYVSAPVSLTIVVS